MFHCEFCSTRTEQVTDVTGKLVAMRCANPECGKRYPVVSNPKPAIGGVKTTPVPVPVRRVDARAVRL